MRAFGYAEENPLRFFTDSYYRRLIAGIEKELNIYWWMLCKARGACERTRRRGDPQKHGDNPDNARMAPAGPSPQGAPAKLT
jgi:hypothetical protein